jgi:Ca2+-binding RTX toxin-like protein
MRLGRARAIKLVLALATVLATGVLAAATLGNHDTQHPFAGEWAIKFHNIPDTGTFRFDLLTEAEGGDVAGQVAMNGIALQNHSFATTELCQEPSDYYTGTFEERDQSGAIVSSGTFAGCTTGGGRSIYAPYTVSGGVGYGVYFTASLDSSGGTLQGQLFWDFDGDGVFLPSGGFDGTFTAHFDGDGSVTAPVCRAPAGPAPPDCPPEEPPPQEPEETTPLVCRGRQATIIQDAGSSAPIVGTDGPDVIVGTSGADLIFGGGGEDVICARGSDDQVEAGTGEDHVYGEGGNDVLKAGAGRDQLEGGAGDDTLMGEEGVDRLLAGAGKDTLEGGPLPDFLEGGPGADVLDGGAGEELTAGPLRYGDVAFYDNSPSRVIVDLANGTASGGAGVDRLIDIERVGGSDFDDVLRGSANDETLSGLDGDDRIDGRGGSDRLDGWFGDDRITGGGGNDQLTGHFGRDILVGGVGKDRVDGGDGKDTCRAEQMRACELLAVGPGVIG